jgi:hypothetical protein
MVGWGLFRTQQKTASYELKPYINQALAKTKWNQLHNTVKEKSMEEKERNHVVVVDVKMPFLSMVVFLVKWTIAAIPALIILAILGSLFFGLIAGMGWHHRTWTM